MSRLLTTLLLYQNGYMIGKFISLEQKIERTKDSYYAALAQSGAGWHTGDEDVVPLSNTCFALFWRPIVILKAVLNC